MQGVLFLPGLVVYRVQCILGPYLNKMMEFDFSPCWEARMPFGVKYNILSPPASCFTADPVSLQKFLEEAYYPILFLVRLLWHKRLKFPLIKNNTLYFSK